MNNFFTTKDTKGQIRKRLINMMKFATDEHR